MMRKVLFLFSFCFCCYFVKAQSDSIPVGLPDDLEASFNGGVKAMMQFIANEFKYPERAIEHGIQGKVYLRFTIQKDGVIRDIKVAKGIPDCPECDAEAVRIASKMPPWIPARRDGIPIDSYYTFPLTFRIQ